MIRLHKSTKINVPLFYSKVEALSENGCLSFENFMASIPEDLQADLEVEQEHFDVMDTNGDGKICQEEMSALDEPANRDAWARGRCRFGRFSGNDAQNERWKTVFCR